MAPTSRATPRTAPRLPAATTPAGTAYALQFANGQVTNLAADPGLTFDAVNHVLNAPSLYVAGAQENGPQGIYDPMDPKYAGGLGAATTAQQQSAVLQATLDQASCDMQDGKIGSAKVIWPASINGNVSNIAVHSNTEFMCSQESPRGSCQLVESDNGGYPNPTATSGAILLRADFSLTTTCHGQVTYPGADNVSIHGFQLSGADADGGGHDIGIQIWGTGDRVTRGWFGLPVFFRSSVYRSC